MPTPQYGDYQMEIYGAGLHGQLPRFPVDYASLERAAIEALPSWVYSYVGYGAGDGGTQRANVEAFSRYGIVPRMLVAPTERDLSVSLFDMQLSSPLFMPPVGVVGVCSQDLHGDIQVAQASARTGVPMVASTLTQDRMEDVVPHAGETPNLFQLYTSNDKELAASFVRRAEQSGYKAVVVTLDTWITGWRPHDLNMANFPQLRGYCLQNYFTDDVFLGAAVQITAGRSSGGGPRMGEGLWPSSTVGRPQLAASIDKVTDAAQGHSTPRRCAQSARLRHRRHLLL